MPARSTVYGYFDLWDYEGTLMRIHHALFVECREQGGARRVRRQRSSTARASRARKKGASIDPLGFDLGKKIKGKKRHILIDTQGRLMHALVHSAGVQIRDDGVG